MNVGYRIETEGKMTLSRSHAMRILFFWIGCIAVFGMLPVQTHAVVLPEQGAITHGSGAIGVPTTDGELTITQQSERMIIQWDSFSIGTDGAVHFDQAFDAVVLNRVLGGSASHIEGALTGDGQIFVVNPHGVLFSDSARVDVGGLVASTLDLDDSDFVSGAYSFSAGTIANEVTNHGTLTSPGGYIALIAPTVRNDGTITAHLGTIVIAAGGGVTLEIVGDGLAHVEIDEAILGAFLENGHNGTLAANGGHIIMRALRNNPPAGTGDFYRYVIDQFGVVQATSVEEKDGRITLSGGPIGRVTAWGSMTASGDMEISAGEDIELIGTITGTGAGRLTMRADAEATGEGTIVADSDAVIDFTASTGDVEFIYNPVDGHINPQEFDGIVMMGTGDFILTPVGMTSDEPPTDVPGDPKDESDLALPEPMQDEYDAAVGDVVGEAATYVAALEALASSGNMDAQRLVQILDGKSTEEIDAVVEQLLPQDTASASDDTEEASERKKQSIRDQLRNRSQEM